MQAISNILFDIGNVILDLDIEGAKTKISALRRNDLPDDQFLKAITPVARSFEIGALTSEDFVQSVLEYSRPDTTASAVIEAWNSMLVTIPAYRLGMLTALRDNFTLLALSNTNHLHVDHLHSHLETAHGITDFEKTYFDDAYYSHEIGARKPNQEAFQHVIEDALITPRRTLFVDDHPGNIATAKSLGFQVMHSPPDHEIAEALKLQGFY